MSERSGPSGSAANSGRGSAVRRGYEVYTPAGRGGNRSTTTSDGHDNTRHRGLWEDTQEAARLPKGDKEWKRDKWDDDDDQTSQTSGSRPPRAAAAGDSSGRTRRTHGAASPAQGSGPRGRGGVGRRTDLVAPGNSPASSSPTAASVETEVPTGEQYEDISRRVEEEVVAKLARAQMMGMMLKAHRQQEVQRRGAGGSRSGGGGRRRRAGHRDEGEFDRGSAGERDRDRTRDRNWGGGGGNNGMAAPRQVSNRRADVCSGRGSGNGGRGRTSASMSQHAHLNPSGGARSGASGAQPTKDDRQRSQQPTRAVDEDNQRKATAGVLRVPLDQVIVKSTSKPGGDASASHEDLGADPDAMDVDEAYTVVGKLERQHKALIEDFRKETGLVSSRSSAQGVAPVPVSGPAAVAAASAAAATEQERHLPETGTPSGKLLRVRGALSRALGSLVRRNSALSLRKRLPNRLWMAYYRELEIIQHRLRQLSGSGGTIGSNVPPQQLKQVQASRARLIDVIEAAERFIGEMVEAMEEQIEIAEQEKHQGFVDDISRHDADHGPARHRSTTLPKGGLGGADAADEDGDGEEDSAVGGAAGSCDDSDEEDDSLSEEERGRRQALQAFLTSLGDLARYRALHGDSRGRGNGGVGGWARAEALYLRALRVDPSSGKVWNQMAVLSSSRGDNLEAFYAYLRAVCATAPFPSGRENLLILHEKCKARLSTLREATALDALGFEEHQARFRLYLLGACGTCLSRIDLGTFDGYLALAERHMVSCVQLHLMRPAAGHGSGDIAGGGRLGNGRGADGGAGMGPGDDGKGLEGTLARAIILCVCTASASFEAWRSRGMEGGSWTQDAATSRAVRLCLSLAGSLAGLHRKTSKRGWEKLTAAGVGIFLDWLTCRPQFGEGARGTRLEEFQRVMACVVEFANGIVRSAASESAGRVRAAAGRSAFSSRGRASASVGEKAAIEVIDADPDGSLWEDEECRGLPAMETVTERRAFRATKRARSFNRREAGSSSTITPSKASAASDPWLTRVARLRKQVEFCVERGWIARGVTPGTYTLPKSPSRVGSSRSPRQNTANYGDIVDGHLLQPQPQLPLSDHHPPEAELYHVGFPVDDQPPHDASIAAHAVNAAATSGNGTGKRAPSPQRVSLSSTQIPPKAGANTRPRQPRVPIFPPGHRDLSLSPPTTGAAGPSGVPVTSTGVAQSSETAAAAAAQAMSALTLKGDPRDTSNPAGVAAVIGESGYGIVGGLEDSFTGTAEASASLAVDRVDGRQITKDAKHMTSVGAEDGETTAAAAATTSAAPLISSSGAHSRADVSNMNDCNDGGDSLPESLMGIVMAGLGATDESLCAYCCVTLDSERPETCPVCGTPVPGAVATPAVVDEIGPAPVHSKPTPEGAEASVGGGVSAAVISEQSGPPIAPAASGHTAGISAGPALPAGVLAVNNLAEVMASSQRPKPQATGTAGSRTGPHGSGSNRSRARDAHNPSTIARAGLGDGGAGRGGGVVAGGKMFGWPRGAPRHSALPLIVIDVPNVAMRHGLNKKFSCKGVQMAMEYFRTAGHRVLGFLPDYYLDEKRTNGLERAKKLGVAEVRASRLPDDVLMLKSMVEDGLIIATPPQDYDDSYCIKYGMAKDGYVVTNDLYRDHVKGVEGRKKAEAARRWIKTHSVSYTFVGDEFFPNPDFSFNQDQGANMG